MRGLAATALGVGAAGFAYYHAQQPTSQLYGATVCQEPAAAGQVALTYDDGPNPRHTPALLETLARYEARATFFSIGRWAEREPDLLHEVQAAGHAIGNHTWSHPTLALCSAGEVTDELNRCRGAVEAAGVSFAEVDGAALMRPPWGRRRPGTLRAVRSAGYVPVLWSVTCWDWRERESADDFAARGKKARGGDVILLHDGSHLTPEGDRGRSVEATEMILHDLTDKGLRFVTIPELAGAARAVSGRA